jgi:(p)ppGpp synthase/HD superfamily hydrolase
MRYADIVGRAKAFAIEAHHGQKRRNLAQDPYWTHLAMVADFVEKAGGTDEEIAAAWLHDVREDVAGVTDTVIRSQFGDAIADIVDGLTDPPDFRDLGTLERKTMQADRVRGKSASVKRGKMADQASNVLSVADQSDQPADPTQCSEYVEGARRIAAECAGVSPYLDEQFRAAYEKAAAKYPWPL